MTAKQDLAKQIAIKAVRDWREEEAMAADGIALSKGNAIACLTKAVSQGVSQADLAREAGFSRQRLHQLLNV
jgi:hypothetical protein